MLFLKRILFLLLLLTPAFSHAASNPSSAQNVTEFSKVDSAQFKQLRQTSEQIIGQKLIDATSFLAKNNEIFRLAGIDVPISETENAMNLLRPLIEGQNLKIFVTKNQDKGRVNRMGQNLAHVQTQNKIWAQGVLLENGFARVMLKESNTELATPMLSLENKARQNKKGLWAKNEFKILSSDEVLNHLNSFQIVEGQVKAVAVVRNQIFLNFGMRGGTDWRRDFTLGISPAMRKKLNKNGINSMNLQNAQIRVRGFVQNYNGAYIDLENAEDLEVLKEGNPLPVGEISQPKLPETSKPQIEKPSAPTLNKRVNE